MPDDPDYRRKMDDQIIGFLAAHEVWMVGDTAHKALMIAEIKGIKNRVYSLEKWRNYLAGAWAVVVAAWYILKDLATGHKA